LPAAIEIIEPCALLDLTRVGAKFYKTARENTLAFGVEHKLRTVAKKPACWALKHHAHRLAVWAHIFKDALTQAETLDDRPLKCAWRIDHDFFKRLKDFAVALLQDDVWLGDLHLVALAAHVLEQNSDMELATTRYVESLALIKLDAEPNVDLELALKTLAIWREVTNLPSRPANGELLTKKSSVIVGSSIAIAGSGSTFSSLVTVSPI
jgi:hypothetical protein